MNAAQTLWKMHDAMYANKGGCEHCGETDEFSPNVEAFELTDELLCDECAEAVFKENSQFGLSA